MRRKVALVTFRNAVAPCAAESGPKSNPGFFATTLSNIDGF